VLRARLRGKNLSAITKAMQSDYNQVAKIASELEIKSSECKNAVTEQTFIQAPVTIGRPVEILSSNNILMK